jgi:hypothetical protein
LGTAPAPRTFGGQFTKRQGAIYDDIIRAAKKEAEPYGRIQDEIDTLSRTDQENIKNSFLEEIAGEESLSESELAFAARDAEEFLTPKPTTKDYIGKVDTGELAGVPNDFNLVNPEGTVGQGDTSKKNMTPTEGMFGETKGETEGERIRTVPEDRNITRGSYRLPGEDTSGDVGDRLQRGRGADGEVQGVPQRVVRAEGGETKAGDIHPGDTWGGYQEGLDSKVRQTWKTKLEGFVNGLQRIVRENRDSQVAGDTSYGGEHEVSILRRLRDRRLLDEEMRGANQRNDRERWTGVDISPTFADTPEFKLGERHFASLGYQTVPVTRLPWGMAVNTNTKVVFMGEMSGDNFAYFVSHETSHILSNQGNAEIAGIREAINLNNDEIKSTRELRGWTEDYTRDEYAAAIVGGMNKPQWVKGDQTANIKTARETSTQDGKPTGSTKGGTSYGFVQPRPPAFYSTPNTPASYTMYGDINPPTKPPSTNQPASWDSPEESRKSFLFWKMFDNLNDAQAMQDAIKKKGLELTDETDPMLKARAYRKIRADQTRRFYEGEVANAFKRMKDVGMERDDLEKYMHNFIAEDVNNILWDRYVAKVEEDNLNRSDENQKEPDESKRDGLSGIKTADAQKYLASLKPADIKRYEYAAKAWWEMGEGTLKTLVGYQLESPDTVATWKNTWKKYLPLYRDMGESSPVYQGIGEGFSVTGSSSKARVGSTERNVVNPIANLIIQRERAIIRGEKNKVDQAFVGLEKMAPNPDWWEAAKAGTKKAMVTSGPSKGKMESTLDQSYKHDDNVIMARFLVTENKMIEDPITGKKVKTPVTTLVERGVRFNKNNVRALRMAHSLKNVDINDLGTILGASAVVTRFIARANTQWSPTFGPANFARDVQFALLNLTNTPLKGKQRQVMQGLPATLGVIYSELRARRNGTHSTHSMSAVYDRFLKVGGQQEYSNMFGASDEMSQYIDEMTSKKTPELTFMNITKRGIKLLTGNVFMRWLSDVNTTLENAVRLSVFNTGINNGMTDAKAGALANGITIDFDTKGDIARQAGALFAFFNASARGGLKTYETLTGPRGKQIIMGGIALGAINTLVLMAAGFGDDEPPEFVKERNLIIPTGGKSYKTIPFPLGMHILPNLGRLLTEGVLDVSKGKSINPIKGVARFADLLADAFNPLGGGGLSVQTFTPTPLRPFVSLAENKDWNQQQISRPNFSSLKPIPGFQRSKDIASVAAQGIARALNALTGGTQASPGLLSPTADQIDFLVGQTTGGLGRELIKIQSIAGALYQGEEIPAYKIPLVGRFHGSTEGAAQESQRFYNNIKLLNRHELEIKQRIRDREPVSEYLQSNPESRYWKMADRVENQVRQLMDRKRHMVEKDASKDSIRNMNNLIAAQMKRLNDTVARAEL